MDYLKIYTSLILRAKKRTLTGPVEKHHIISRCIFEDSHSNEVLSVFKTNNVDDKENLVKLTCREHYIAHLLLVRVFEAVSSNCYIKLLHAANFIKGRAVNNRNYEWLRLEYSKYMSQKLTGKPSLAKGTKWSSESREKRTGKNHFMYNKTYEEVFGKVRAEQYKEVRRKAQSGREKSEETRSKLSKRRITKEWKEKLSTARRGKKLSQECKDKIKLIMSNDKINPNVDQTLYTFYHIDGRVVNKRKIDMKREYGCWGVLGLIRGKLKHCRGWYLNYNFLVEENEKSNC